MRSMHLCSSTHCPNTAKQGSRMHILSRGFGHAPAGRSAAACRGARSWSASGAPRRCGSAGGTCSARSARARSSPPAQAMAHRLRVCLGLGFRAIGGLRLLPAPSRAPRAALYLRTNNAPCDSSGWICSYKVATASEGCLHVRMTCAPASSCSACWLSGKATRY